MCWSNLGDLVVKEVHGSGGYGMLVGPKSTKAADRGLRRAHQGRPGQLHRPADAGAVDLPTFVDEGHRAAPCRSAALLPGRRARSQLVPGGLTRVALQRGLAGGQFVARAAGSRTPGCWRSDAMLSRTADNLFWIAPLHGAGRDHGAAAGGRRAHRAAAARSGTATATNGTACCSASGTAAGFAAEIRRPGAAQHRKLSVLRPRQPVVGRLLHRDARARTAGSCAPR